MDIRIESAGGVASRTTLGPHTLLFDQPPELGGEDGGPSPLDVMVASVGACAHYYAAAFLRARKYDTSGIVVAVQAEKAQEGPRRIATLRITVTVPPEVPETLVPRVEQAVLACPAWGTLHTLPDATLTIRRG